VFIVAGVGLLRGEKTSQTAPCMWDTFGCRSKSATLAGSSRGTDGHKPCLWPVSLPLRLGGGGPPNRTHNARFPWLNSFKRSASKNFHGVIQWRDMTSKRVRSVWLSKRLTWGEGSSSCAGSLAPNRVVSNGMPFFP
jgi:hypothetical protein